MLEADAALIADETLDAINGGLVRLFQHRHGYRFNLDPLLLVDFAYREGSLVGPAVDLGAGCGVISLLLARRFGVASVGLELQQSLFELAQRNIALNRCEDRVSLVRGDLREVRQLLPGAAFRQVFCNPPYHARRAGHWNPVLEKALARHELACTAADVVEAAAYLLAPQGSLWLVFPAARLAHWLGLCARASLVPARLRCVHPREGRSAKLALLRADKQGRAALKLLPPLFLHAPAGPEFSSEVQALLA